MNEQGHHRVSLKCSFFFFVSSNADFVELVVCGRFVELFVLQGIFAEPFSRDYSEGYICA